MERYCERLHLTETRKDYRRKTTCAIEDLSGRAQHTTKVEHVECTRCLEVLLKHRRRNLQYFPYVETPAVFLSRNDQILARLLVAVKERKAVEKKEAKALQRRKEQKEQEAELLRMAKEAKQMEKDESCGAGRHAYEPSGPYETRENDYEGHDIGLPATVLDAALLRAAGGTPVDCDEWTLALRMQRGRDLVNSAAWGLVPQTLRHSNKRDEEYWEW